MHIEINGDIESLNSEIVVSHKGIKTIWNSSLFDKTSFKSNVDVFAELNHYWSIIPEHVADSIFGLYKIIKTTCEQSYNLESMILELRKSIAELIDVYHAEEEIEKFIQYYGHIRIPDTVKDTMVFEAGSQTTSEKTYLTHDYRKLVIMVIRLRSLVPVWGDFVFKIRKQAGPQFKEMSAFQLLDKSNIVDCAAMEKLRTFIKHQGVKDPTDAAVVYCVSSDDYEKWFLANIVVRRLSIGNIRGTNDDSNLIKNMHQYIKRKNNNPKNSNGPNSGGKFDSSVIRLDPITSDDNGDDSNLSVLEGQKAIEEGTIGDTAAIDFYVQDPIRVAKKIDPTLPDKLIQDALINTGKLLNNHKLADAQLAIVKFVLDSVIPPRAFINETALTAIRAVAVTQALLWHWGYKELAAIVSAIKENNADEVVLNIKTWSRITPELNAELMRLFPFGKRSSNHEKSKIEAMAILSLEEICTELRNSSWNLTLTGEYLKDIMGDVHSTRYSVPYNIRIILANFVIMIVKRGNE